VFIGFERVRGVPERLEEIDVLGRTRWTKNLKELSGTGFFLEGIDGERRWVRRY
jgi:hypothetical protein